MENIGMLDPNLNPIRPGGLSAHDVAYLKKQGWKEGKTKKLVKDVPVGFAAPEIPGGFVIHLVNIPKGTRFLFNPLNADGIIWECGNATVKRHLL